MSLSPLEYSEKIQSKIWANEYIDLGTLLHRTSPSDYKYNFVVQTTQSNDRPVISLEPAQKAKRIIAIDQWITAFQTFVAIYTVRFPKDAPALMKYSETVRDLAAKNAHWRYYDENSRFLRQKTLFPWDQIHWELWLQAHHMQKAAPVASSDARNKNLKSPFPSGYCWKFHRGECGNVPAAISATNVLNVDLSIPPTNVPFQSEYHIQHQQPCHERHRVKYGLDYWTLGPLDYFLDHFLDYFMD